MKFIIDIGNSSVKLALFKQKLFLRSAEIETCSLQKMEDFIMGDIISRTILSSVRNIDNTIMEVIDHYKAVTIDKKTKLPIKIRYNTPEKLGVDRIAAVVGASSMYPAKNILVLDFGSCLTIDFINNKKEYIGGRISPGLNMRYNALHQFTDQLPHCKKIDIHRYIGDDTISSIQSGVQEGILSEVNEVIKVFRKENKESIVIFTGGDCFFFEKALKNSIFAHPFLVMQGLNEILDYNE